MKRKLFKALLCICFVILLFVSFSYFFSDITDYYQVKNEYGDIREKVKKERKIDWDKLRAINDDIVAWIEIPDTSIDYPVLQTKSNAKYLTEDIYGNYSQYGSIFLDERLYGTNLGENPNNIIYGHNMGHWTDVMFGSLKEYLDSDYLKDHETVFLYTPEKTYKYQIASVCYGTEYSDIYEVDFNNIVFSDWIQKQIQNSLYPCLKDTDVTAYIDKFSPNDLIAAIKDYGNTLTLSTCDTTHYNNKKICIFCIPKKK